MYFIGRCLTLFCVAYGCIYHYSFSKNTHTLFLGLTIWYIVFNFKRDTFFFSVLFREV